MTDNQPALKACPFCGNDGTGPIEEALHVSHEELEHHPWYNVYSVQCDKCGASSGYSETEDEAITLWNTRHQPAQGDVVAWQAEHKRFGQKLYFDADIEQFHADWSYTPLYASPAPDATGIISEKIEVVQAARKAGTNDAPALLSLARAVMTHSGHIPDASKMVAPDAIAQARREEVISAWAFAHNIDGAARNDLFKRLKAIRARRKAMTDNCVYSKIKELAKDPSPAAQIVVAIWRDVTDRRGWRQEHDRFDPETQCEIVDQWIAKAEEILGHE